MQGGSVCTLQPTHHVPSSPDTSVLIKNDDAEDNPNHHTSPSKVVHCRAVAVGCRETDLIEVLKLFGNITALKLIPKCSQALVEFEVLESAVACVTFSRLQPIVVNGRRMYVNYSKSTEISRSYKNFNQHTSPTNVLLLTIINVMYQVSVDTIKAICQQQNIFPQRIVIFHKNGLQVLVEFRDVMDATHILQLLNGCDIYPGCCNLKIEFSRIERLNVRSNTTELYNIEFDTALQFAHDPAQQYHQQVAAAAAAYSAGYQAVNMTTMQPIQAAAVPAGAYPGDPTAAAQQAHTSFMIQNALGDAYATQTPHMDAYTAQALAYTTAHAQPQQPPQPPPQPQEQAVAAAGYLEHYPSPFPEISVGVTPGAGAATAEVNVGGEGCVAMVHGINNELTNCNHLFNLFCLYGNIVKIKILDTSGVGLVQYADKLSTEMAIQYLNNLILFGNTIQITFSKHASIEESSQSSTLFDCSPSEVSFQDSRNNRFKPVPGGRNDLFSRIHPPSKVLHYFNAPPDCSDERVVQLFESFNASVPVKQLAVSKPGSKSSSGLVEFSTLAVAVEALVLVNHVTLRKSIENVDTVGGGEKSGAPFTFKLAFSTSESINTR